MTTTTATSFTEGLSALQAQAMAETEPCDGQHWRDEGHPTVAGCTCTGTQPKFPGLRVDCPGGLRRAGQSECDPMNITGLDGDYHVYCRTIRRMHWRTDEWVAKCPGGCGGKGYHWNPDPDAITEAIRAAGWRIVIMSEPQFDGDFVDLYLGYGVAGTHLASVTPDEALRGQAALLTALLRACGREL